MDFAPLISGRGYFYVNLCPKTGRRRRDQIAKAGRTREKEGLHENN